MQADHRTDFNVGIGRRSNAKLSCFFDAEISEAFGDGLLDVNAFDREAGLAAIGETAPDGCARSNFEFGVRENDHRVLSAQLEHGRN